MARRSDRTRAQKVTFDQAFGRLVGHEAGFSIDPRDPGNWTGGRPNAGELKGTKFGIAANTYPDIDIPNLTLDRAKEIYRRDWWLKIGADMYDPAIAFQLWDFAVNAGMETAKRALQRAVRVADDGGWDLQADILCERFTDGQQCHGVTPATRTRPRA